MRLPSLLLLCATPLAAQTLVTVPNGYENLEGTSASRTPFGWASGRVQYLVDGAQLCTSFAVVDNLRLRLDGGNFNVDALAAKTFTATIQAYEVPITPQTMISNFASNIGSAVPTLVYSGPLSIPAAPRIRPYPNPWTIDIPLQNPILYQRANGNLMLDILLTGSTGDNWPVDGFFFHATEPRGETTRIWADSACTSASGSLSTDVPAGFGNGAIGSSLVVTHTATPTGGATIDFVYHVLGFDKLQSGGVPLPVGLGAIGAPACDLNVDPFFGALVATGAGLVSWNVPSLPELVGVPVFTQAAGLDFGNGVFVPSNNAWQVRLGASVPNAGPAQMVHQSNYSGQSSGALSPTGYFGMVVGFFGTFV